MPTLGLITNNRHNVFQSNVIAGVQAAAHERSYDLIIDSYAENEANPQPITLDYNAVEGVLVGFGALTAAAGVYLRRRKAA